MKKRMVYAAFISYKHQVDTQFAEDFELDLKRYAKGFLARPARIFRDEQYLKVGEDLPNAIRKALEVSDYFILLASPKAALSPWVEDEIEIWCNKLKRSDRIIIVNTSGKIIVDSEKKAIDWAQSDALPSSLRPYLSELPLFVDLSWATSKEKRDLGDPRYKTAVNTIVARLRGVTPNELIGREWQLRRRSLTIAWTTALSLFCLLLLVIAGALLLQKQKRNLEAALNRSRSGELSARSQLEQAPQALNTAADALELNPSNDSIRALLNAMNRFHALKGHIIDAGEAIETMAQKGEELTFPKRNGSLVRLLPQGEMIQKSKTNIEIKKVAWLDSGTLIVADDYRLWDWEKATEIIAFPEDGLPIAMLAPGPSGTVFIAFADGRVIRFDLRSKIGNPIHRHEGQPTSLVSNQAWVISTALSRKTPVLLTLISSGKTMELTDAPFSANTVSISPDGGEFAVGFEDGHVGTWLLPSLEQKWSRRLAQSVSAVAYHPEKPRLAIGTSNGTAVVVNGSGDERDIWQAIQGGLWVLKWRGEALLTAGSDGWLKTWRLEKPAPLGKILPNAERFYWRGDTLTGVHEKGIWRYEKGKVTVIDGHFGKIAAIANDRVVSFTKRQITWQSVAGEGSHFPNFPADSQVRAAAISEKGDTVAVCFWHDPAHLGEGRVALWHISDNRVSWLEGAPPYPETLAFLDNSSLAVAGSRGSLSVWELPHGDLISQHSGAEDPTTALAFKDSEFLIVGKLQGRLEIKHVLNHKIHYQTNIPSGAVRHLSVLPDGSIVAIDGDGVAWFDKELNYRGRLLKTTGHLEDAWYAAPSPAGDQLALRMQSRKTFLISLNLDTWSQEARKRAKPHYVQNKSSENN